MEAGEQGRPGRGGNGVARGGEEEEAAAGGLGVELHDLRVVADGGDRAAEWRGGNDVGGEIEAADHRTTGGGGGGGGGCRGGPGERGVEREAAVEAVGEEVPLRRDGDGGGHRRTEWGLVAGCEARRERGRIARERPGLGKKVDSEESRA
nr:unnamed protein product [Digitaria exilis]